ncbi:50S ribosomal protein L22 [candidate division CSSED10-310 bacterium]|uniref:Large ribosomal subunit protein uL22 n=1 Tax=candidate division CSSED10-310 bacterium TaxID=2855610 RepID=A0ABV6YWZ6_UNCC1
MEAKAKVKYIRISPRKVRLVADLIRGRRVNDALHTLKYSKQKASYFLEKVLRSALANAETKEDFEDAEDLVIKNIHIDGGPTMKRITPRAMGRASRIRKRMSYIHVVLDDSIEPRS